LVFLLSIGIGLCLARLVRLTHENRGFEERLAALEKKQPVSADLKSASSQPVARISGSPADRELADQILATESAERRLDQVRGLKARTIDAATVESRIEQQKKVVDDLQENLRRLRVEKNALKQRSRVDQVNHANELKNDIDQVNAQLEQEKAALAGLNQELAQAKQTYGNNQFDLQAAQKIKDVQTQITEQNEVIQQLKDDRDDATSQLSYQKSVALSKDQEAIEELEANDQSLSDELAEEKDKLKSLQNEFLDGTESKASRQSLIKDAEANLQAQKAKLYKLQSTAKP
jgi:chromosome segregation ATPase